VPARPARLVAGVLAVLVLAACGGGGASTTVPLSSSLDLATTTVVAGGQITGHVVVRNDTGRVLHAEACGSIFQALLTRPGYEPTPVWATCVQRVTIGRGRSTYRVTVTASYSRCSQSGPEGTVPACTPTGAPPLPAGRYEATVFEQGTVVPLPAPVPVRVAAR